ncbi:hypothetical protein A4X03_0g8179 [Tilletia caries]|uniref:Uncharacterized protein n=1 Tax=Tilletia caries TaxID=13290 RepID=A0A8T8SKU6_9BASI|nr:hypothetical protein A4X03_0g8179 [Tilletia caries]
MEPARRPNQLPDRSAETPVVLSSQTSTTSQSVLGSTQESTETSLLNPGRSKVLKWTTEQEHAFVRAIHDNPRYQAALLPGHSQDPDDATPQCKINHLSIMRNISAEIFPDPDQRNAPQMKQKLRGLVRVYRKEVEAMSETGRGLLLEEMTAGPLKTQRELLLNRLPWFDLMHAMMRNRAASDSDIIVNGVGEQQTQQSSFQDDEEEPGDEQEPEQPHDDFDEDDEGGVSQFTRQVARGEVDAPFYDDETFDDEDDRASPGRPRAQLPSFVSQTQPRRGAGCLPSLSRLSDQSLSDSMRSGAINNRSNSISQSSFSVSQSSSSAVQSSNSKGAASSTPTKREPVVATRPNSNKNKGKQRSSAVDDALDTFSRQIQDDQELRIEREQTKLRKLDLRCQELAFRSQEREHEADFLNTRLGALETIMTSLNAKVDTILAKLGGR